ncbi:MAG: PD-(D/E)XK nuclease family protein, partial [Sulfurovum sp.]|nr:PD-(D/E)XK nuclease family protein [Sulfurovum sp.]
MNILQVYPTSRALRTVMQQQGNQEGFLPTLMCMDEFENRTVLLDDATMVDPLQRTILLKKSTEFESFKKLKIDRDLVRFFTKSDALFKFFEELSFEQVTLEVLAKADPYAEFGDHLRVLGELKLRYEEILASKGMIDRMFIPKNYRLNEGFLKSYGRIEIYIEGYLSHFELTLLQQVANYTQVVLSYYTSRFTKKMQERFESCGIVLKEDCHITFDLGAKNILKSTPIKEEINTLVYCVEERDEQVALALMKIEEMVGEGVDPSEIVLVLPDESFKEHFMLFDHLNNLNFAMGYDYCHGRIVRSLEALYNYWEKHDKKSQKLLERYGLGIEKIDTIAWVEYIGVQDFFTFLELLGLEEKRKNEDVESVKYHFEILFNQETFTYKVWLYLWLQALSKVTLDDVRGGKVTVMGALETRGVSFRGVVVVDFNDGVVPATPRKDMFLNSTVRAFSGLPTRQDREALQKQIYNRLLQQAECSVIIYATSENRLPSKFLYELGLSEVVQTKAPVHLLYSPSSQLVSKVDPIVKNFDATTQTWSASRLKTFLECKRKYYYRYLANIKPKEDEELNEGAFLHRLLEELYQEHDYYVSEVEMTQVLHAKMEQLLPNTDSKSSYQKALWRERLKGFVQHEITRFSTNWRVISREMEVHGKIGGLKFKGRIDRIDQNATDTLVLDYKSGNIKEAQKTKNLETLNDLQMSIYYQLLQGKYQNIRLAFVKLFEGGEVEEITALEEKNERLAEVIIELKQTKNFVAEKCED